MRLHKLKLLSAFLILIFAAPSMFILNSCHCSCGISDASDVPLSVLNKAEEFIISKTGKHFFDYYIAPDFTLTKFNPPYYNMAYRLYIPEKPYVNAEITFTVDSLGNVDTTKEIIGIPDCAGNPELCSFSVDKKKAEEIAAQNGLKKGVIPWKTAFMWNKEMGQYVWHVLSTLKESGGKENYSGNGEDFIIDPNSGKILDKNYWHIP